MNHFCCPKYSPIFEAPYWQCECGRWFQKEDASIQIIQWLRHNKLYDDVALFIGEIWVQKQRILISEKTKLRLEQLKNDGIKLGRPIKFSREKLIELRAKGLSCRQIGKEVGLNHSTVAKALRKLDL